jgi:hypothetical protein
MDIKPKPEYLLKELYEDKDVYDANNFARGVHDVIKGFIRSEKLRLESESNTDRESSIIVGTIKGLRLALSIPELYFEERKAELEHEIQMQEARIERDNREARDSEADGVWDEFNSTTHPADEFD